MATFAEAPAGDVAAGEKVRAQPLSPACCMPTSRWPHAWRYCLVAGGEKA